MGHSASQSPPVGAAPGAGFTPGTPTNASPASPPPHPPPAPGAKTKAHPGKGAGRPQRGPVPKPGSLGGWGLCVSAAGLLPCPHGLGGICLPEGLYLWLWLGQGGRGGRKMATRAHHLLPEAKRSNPAGETEPSGRAGRGPGGEPKPEPGRPPSPLRKGRRGKGEAPMRGRDPGAHPPAAGALAPWAPARPHPGTVRGSSYRRLVLA